MEIQKVKEWKANQLKQFEITECNEISITEVVRLKDRIRFFLHCEVTTSNLNGNVAAFDIDCIHILIINNNSYHKVEIDKVIANQRRPRRRIQALKKHTANK